ncbi:hypothetical protein QR680_009510 [Steinernema hermaphroditum]|uniref:MULE transposase domain-containing protein n=1 Tax=Steinernema hermaphroditum TaxID=289476 RepID=A0AA39ILU2_9BILA|nr:hypothetical protein QR680_009510 [Steinernema hermaphroditum]
MEISAMNACRQVFPESRITTCYFHFAKNIMDKVHRVGLRDYYADRDDTSMYNWIRIFIGSALLPRDLFDERIWPYIERNVPQGRDSAEEVNVRSFATNYIGILTQDLPKLRRRDNSRAEERMLVAKTKLINAIASLNDRELNILDLVRYCKHQAKNCSAKTITSLLVLGSGNQSDDEFDLVLDPEEPPLRTDDELMLDFGD